jgi:hypothetical protein
MRLGHSRKRDVLTGIITSLLAQSYEPITAAILGAYAFTDSLISLCQKRPSVFHRFDIIKYLGKHFLSITNKSLKGLKSLYFQFVKQINRSVSDGLGAWNLQCCHLGRLE